MSEPVAWLREATPVAQWQGNRVQLLPAEVVEQIAAGEVVERPASVVKELVENSLDAGARHIRIELEDAGSGLIAVVDDGEGMSEEDARLAVRRHATSKIRSVADLERVATFGFRGEALASIAAVSTLVLVSRRREDLSGTRVVVRAGEFLECAAVGAPPGTRVEVMDLFGNVPARRKFLKAPATELGHVSEVVTRFALAFPKVSFVLKHGTRTLLDFPASVAPEERLAQVFGRDRAELLIPFAGEVPGLGRLWGYLSDPHLTLPSPRQVFSFVNGRTVRDKLLVHALTAGYSTLLMQGRYPVAVLFLELAPGELDVNVHPAKTEVRFRRAQAVHELVRHAVAEALRAHAPLSSEEAAVPTPSPSAWTARPWAGARTEAPAVPTWVLHPPWRQPARPQLAAPVGPETGEGKSGFAGLRVIGQVFEGYWVCEGKEALFLIDQHAAHERVVFERLRRSYASGQAARQQLLVASAVEVGVRGRARLEEAGAEVERFGFEIEPFGEAAVLVRAVPALLAHMDPAMLVRDLAEELLEVESTQSVQEALDRVFARLACHSAVRVGQTLSHEQFRALLEAMDEAELPGNCPHGRPAFLRWPRVELERLFRRV